MKQLYVPEKLKVGFQNRNDTFTKKLAYVIYVDHAGKVRKETSWQRWRDKNIDPIDLANEPTEGFVLNKKVGGYRSSYNYRDAHVRVYDPRDFEFEISVPNLLFILSNCDCSRGKGLEGKFVYAWDGTELVLLPVCAEEYKTSKSFTSLQAKSVKAKELIPGATYIDKDQVVTSYLGRFDCYHTGCDWDKSNKKYVTKEYVFWSDKTKTFVFRNDLKRIASVQSEEVRADYSDLVQKYYESGFGSRAVELFTKPKSEDDKENLWVIRHENGDYATWCTEYAGQDKGRILYTRPQRVYRIVDGILKYEYVSDSYETRRYHPDELARKDRPSWYGGYIRPYVAPTNLKLWCRYESGAEHPVGKMS